MLRNRSERVSQSNSLLENDAQKHVSSYIELFPLILWKDKSWKLTNQMSWERYGNSILPFSSLKNHRYFLCIKYNLGSTMVYIFYKRRIQSYLISAWKGNHFNTLGQLVCELLSSSARAGTWLRSEQGVVWLISDTSLLRSVVSR